MPASAKVKYDPITKDRQDLYVSQGTEGHGLPTVSYVSGVIGGALGGIGGSMVYYYLMIIENKNEAEISIILSNIKDLICLISTSYTLD